MISMRGEKIFNASSWNALIAELPDAHLLQSWQWGSVKADCGWAVLPQVWRDEENNVQAAALVLERSLPLPGLKILYVPRGPLMNWDHADLRRKVLEDLQTFAKQRGAIFIKMDPEVILWRGIPGSEESHETATGQALQFEMRERGWKYSTEQIQFRNTVWMDVRPSEDDLLAKMKQKTRYNIRLSMRKGVTVREGSLDDLPMMYRMYAETSVRDGFVIRPEAYYLRVWELFMSAGMMTALLAEVEGEVVAGLALFHAGGYSWYLHGMSRAVHRNKMPTYLLQWEAMRKTKVLGCERYDLWGAPDVFDESDSMWGVFRFKQGLGGEVICTLGAWDFPARPLLYWAYTKVLPRILNVMRRRGRQRTADSVQL
jgi:lipid II:glycine glycyltransferase (peptidoglycan interpeptide bridge formation enzyme)